MGMQGGIVTTLWEFAEATEVGLLFNEESVTVVETHDAGRIYNLSGGESGPRSHLPLRLLPALFLQSLAM